MLIKILILSIIATWIILVLMGLNKATQSIELKEGDYYCKYNEQPKCYGTPCMICDIRSECDILCGTDCRKCEGLIREELDKEG